MARQTKHPPDDDKSRAAEQQLKAANQQLRASEQQLRAANQQLQASEQQLRAANQQLQTEVTERKSAEAALRKEHSYLEKLIDYSNVPIIVCDPKFRVTRFNRAFEHLTGYRADEIIGRKLSILFPKASRKQSWSKIESSLSGEHRELVEIPFLRKNGEIRLLLWNSANIYGEDGTTLLAIIAQGRDITERKKAEEALRESEAFLNATGRMARVGGWEVDAITKEVRWTQETYQIHEVPLDHKPLLDEAINFFHPEDRPKLARAIRRALKHGEPYDMEIRFITAKGKHLWTHTICKPHIVDGKTVRLTGTFQDITERKKAEEALKATNQQLRASEQQLKAANQQLQATEQQLRAANQQLRAEVTERKKAERAAVEAHEYTESIVQTIREPLIMLDADLRVVSANRSFYKVFKVAPQEIQGRLLYDLGNRQWDIPALRKLLEDILPRKRTVESFEVEHDFETIGQRTMLLNARRLRREKGKPKMILLAIEDITERKKAEETLRISEEKYRTLIESSHEVILCKDWNGHYHTLNLNAAIGLGGTCIEDIEGKTDYDLLPKEQADALRKIDKETMRSGKDVEVEEVVRNAQGEDRIYLSHKWPIYDRQGRVNGTTCFAMDITERKKAEEALRAANQQLRASQQQLRAANQQLQANEQQLKATNQQLQASEQQLRAANQQLQASQQQLLAYQAQLKSLASQLTLTEEHQRHQIATELHATIGQSLVSSKLQLDALRASLPSGSDLAGTLEQVTNLLKESIQQTRTLVFDLSSPVLYELGFETAVADWLDEQIRQKHRIKTKFEDDGQPKPIDNNIRVLLFRDVRELLINVVKHAHATKVKVSISKSGSRIEVSVEDDGWGFDPKKVTATGTKKGGFGLFSIRERLEQLGGRIEIKSAPGCGCKVTMIAPLKEEKH